MIYAFSFTCNRDESLSQMMREGLERNCSELKDLFVINTDQVERFNEYGNGSGWPAAMMKVDRLVAIINGFDVQDDDYILSVDSDVVFTSPEVFTHIHGADIIGVQHDKTYPTRFGAWAHMSGALIFIKGSAAKAIAKLKEAELNTIRFDHFKPFDMTENEDVVLSYLVRYVNGNSRKLPNDLSSGDFESDLLDGKLRAFYHLNYMPEQFLGEPVTGKWMIPGVINKRGIKL